MSKRAETDKYHLYAFDGSETLGSCLQLRACSDASPLLAKCSIQWYRVSPDGSQKEIISGFCYEYLFHFVYVDFLS